MAKKEITYFTEWAEMPREATFDELMTWGGFRNYADNGIAFQLLFANGVFYTGRIGEDTLHKCESANRVDANTI